jgi:hypothetical protein
MNACVFELDDFQTDEDSMYALTELRRRNPKFRATYYTVVGNCDMTVLRDLGDLDWLELALHGLDHGAERFWGYKEMVSYLDYVESFGVFSKLFKMPWFDQMPDGMARALTERGYRLATRRRHLVDNLRGTGTPVWLGCQWTVYAHPPTLPKRMREVEWEAFERFYTVSEMFEHKEALDRQWVIHV